MMENDQGKFVDGGDDFLLSIINFLFVSNHKTNLCLLSKDGKYRRL